jgi:hypothetical protein
MDDSRYIGKKLSELINDKNFNAGYYRIVNYGPVANIANNKAVLNKIIKRIELGGDSASYIELE